MQNLERNLKALANRRRLAILKYLKKCDSATVGDIAGTIRLSFKATSKHLAILSAVDLIGKDQRGLQVFYSITPKLAIPIKNIIEHL